MTRVLVIEPDSSIRETTADGLDGKQALVGGLIEPVALRIIEAEGYVNEEGKLVGLETNGLATSLYHGGRTEEDTFIISLSDMVRDPIVGPLVIFGGIDEEGYDLDVTDDIIERTFKLARDLGY